jgi:predicted nucleic acid-binding protein
MVIALLDTSIVVDILRLNPAANTWISQQAVQLGVPASVWLEVLQGSTNKQTQAVG